MITTPIGMSKIYVCEDTAICVVKNVEESVVHQIAEFIDAMNYTVSVIQGEQKAAESLKYYTAGTIVTPEEADQLVKALS